MDLPLSTKIGHLFTRKRSHMEETIVKIRCAIGENQDAMEALEFNMEQDRKKWFALKMENDERFLTLEALERGRKTKNN